MSRLEEFNPFKGNPLTHLLWKEKNIKGCYGCTFSRWGRVEKKWKCLMEESHGKKFGYPNQVDCRWFEKRRGREEMKAKEYPDWVCGMCGLKARGMPLPAWACPTWHKGKCDVCGETKPVTEPRDFGYPVFK